MLSAVGEVSAVMPVVSACVDSVRHVVMAQARGVSGWEGTWVPGMSAESARSRGLEDVGKGSSLYLAAAAFHGVCAVMTAAMVGEAYARAST